MSLFDTSQNIECVQLSLILKPAVNEHNIWVFGTNSFWFVEESHNHTDTGAMTETHSVDFNTACEYFEDIRPVIENFDENFNKIQVNTGSDKSIPLQIGDVMKEYLPKDSKITITPSELFIAFKNNIAGKFEGVYSGYKLRHDFGQRGFEVDPEKIGYFHCRFESNDEFDDYLKFGDWDKKIIVHYFYPLAMIEQGK